MGERVGERADLVTWTMPREEARDLLRWLRHNRPLGMPDSTFTGLVDALIASPTPATATPADPATEGGEG